MGFKDVQVICPRRDNVVASAHMINKQVQKLLFEGKSVPRSKGLRPFYEGDRIIQTRTDNNTGVSNGDMGVIHAIRVDPERSASFIFSINFDFMDKGELIDYFEENMDDVELAYAITCHKSQGCEFKVAFMPMLQSQEGMLRRNLLNTAVTRGKEIIVLVGQKEAFLKGIKDTRTQKRNTMLCERLKERVFA